MAAWTSGTLTSFRAPLPGAARNEAEPAPAQIAPAPTPPAAPPDTGLLAKARADFARQDVNGAINAYRDLLIQTPDDIDALGELGNVYFAAGRQRDAAQVYYEAALRFVAKKDFERAGLVAAAIRKGDPPLADDLVRKISAAVRGGDDSGRAPDAR